VNRPIRTGGHLPAPGLVHDRPTAELWRRLARPFDSGEVAESLLGIPADVVMELADSKVATGPEATAMLDAMPALMRRLKVGHNSHLERSASGVRGPILWAETVAARSSSFGHSGVYVCAIPGRDYDVDENRILADALRSLAASGERLLRSFDGNDYSDPVAQRARENTDTAMRYLGHSALAHVGEGRLKRRRSRSSVASGRRGSGYGPAVRFLDRAQEPFDPEDLMPFCDRATRSHHSLLVAAIEAIESQGDSVPGLRPEAGAIVVGPYLYVHPLGGRTGSPDVGLLYDDRIVIALDPLGVGGTTVMPDVLVGGRQLRHASTPVDVAVIILEDR